MKNAGEATEKYCTIERNPAMIWNVLEVVYLSTCCSDLQCRADLRNTLVTVDQAIC